MFQFLLTDERDAIQKKTFTKWVNKHLKKVIVFLSNFKEFIAILYYILFNFYVHCGRQIFSDIDGDGIFLL